MKKYQPVGLPANKSEAEALAAIERAVSLLAHRFVFGSYTLEDIKQEARGFGWEALRSYDPSRKLEPFVYRHIKNRLINHIRDNLRRNDPPCLRCHSGMPCSSAGTCTKYREWHTRNLTKSNLAAPAGLESVPDEAESATRCESTAEAEAELRETLDLIDEKLPLELRIYYLQMREGLTPPKAKRDLVKEAVRRILNGEPTSEEEER